MYRKEPISSTGYINVFQKICILSVWLFVIYAYIIQYKYIEIRNGMLLFGVPVLVTFVLSINGKELNLEALFSKECVLTLVFMAYMFIIGFIVSPNLSSHLSQWLNSIEYFLVMMVIVSILGETGSDTFIFLILFTALGLGIILFRSPVEYVYGRYSISREVNPNGLGVTFVAGIWSALFLQQKKKLPLLLSFGILALLGYCIIQTGSRKSMLAALFVLASWLLISFLSNLKRNNALFNIIFFAAMLVLLYVLDVLFLNQYVGSTMEWRMGTLEDEATGGLRYQYYVLGWQLLKDNLLLGLGFTGFQFYYGAYSHATFIEVPVSGGMLGSILYFSTYLISLIKCIRIINAVKNREDFIEEYAEIKMILVLWGVLLFLCTCIIHPYQLLSAILFGIVFGKTVYLERQINSKESNIGELRLKNINHGHSKYIKN